MTNTPTKRELAKQIAEYVTDIVGANSDWNIFQCQVMHDILVEKLQECELTELVLLHRKGIGGFDVGY